MNRARQKQVALFVAAFLVVVSAPILAAHTGLFTQSGDGYHASAGVPYGASDGPTVILGSNTTVENGTPFPDANTVRLQDATFSSNGKTNLTVDQFTGTWTNASAMNVSEAELTINPDDKPAIVVEGDTETLRYSATQVSDGAPDLVYGGSSGDSTITLTDVPANEYLGFIDADSGALLGAGQSTSDGNLTLTVPNSQHTVEVVSSDGAPVLSNPEPSGNLSEAPDELSVDVTDPDFASDTATVEFFVDGTKVGEDTVTDTGVATTSLSQGFDAGGHTWTAVATDEYGQETEETYAFQVPDTLYIRNETSPNELVNDSVTVTVRFYSDDTVVTRETSDGTVNLSGLPVNEDLVVTAQADGYQDRQTVLKSLYEQQNVYLLNENESSVEVRFTLDDNTGRYPEGSSYLFVQKPITRNGSTTYETVTSDEFGVNGFTTLLQEGQRYRLVVESPDGDRRVLSSYTASVPETVPLEIGDVEISNPDDTRSFNWTARQFEAPNGNDTIQFIYQDVEEQTDSITVRVYEYGNESNVLVEDTHEGPLGNLSVSYELTDEQANNTWVVEFEAERDGEVVDGRQVLGDRSAAVEELDPLWKHTISVIVLFIVGGLFGGVRAELGAIVVSLFAGVFWWIQWLPPSVGGGVIAAALGLSVVYRLRIGGGAPA